MFSPSVDHACSVLSDLSLLSNGSVKGAATAVRASLADSTLVEWQENLRRALEHISIVETLVSTVSLSVFGEAQGPPEFSYEADPADVASLLLHTGTGIRVLTECLVSAHANLALARWDALLTQPNQATPSSMQATLRTLPLSSSSLFGPDVAELLRSAQQTKKDDFVVRAAYCRSTYLRPQALGCEGRQLEA